MLTRNECLQAVEDCLAKPELIYRRNAVRCLADFARLTFAEIGSYYSGYQVVKDLSITKRFRLMASVIPEILPFERLFKGIEEERNKVDHHDEYTPKIEELRSLTNDAKKFQEVFESKVVPHLSKLARTPKERFAEEWKIMPPLIKALKEYDGWGSASYDSVREEVEHLESIIAKIDEVAEDAIQEARIKLRDLQNKITAQIESAEADMEWEIGQMEYERWAGK